MKKNLSGLEKGETYLILCILGRGTTSNLQNLKILPRFRDFCIFCFRIRRKNESFFAFFEALSDFYFSIFWLIQGQNSIKLDTRRCKMTWGIDQDLVRPLKWLRSKVIGKKRFWYIPTVWFLQILGKKLIGLVEGWNISYPMYFGTRNILEFTEFKNSPGFSRFLHF